MSRALLSIIVLLIALLSTNDAYNTQRLSCANNEIETVEPQMRFSTSTMTRPQTTTATSADTTPTAVTEVTPTPISTTTMPLYTLTPTQLPQMNEANVASLAPAVAAVNGTLVTLDNRFALLETAAKCQEGYIFVGKRCRKLV